MESFITSWIESLMRWLNHAFITLCCIWLINRIMSSASKRLMSWFMDEWIYACMIWWSTGWFSLWIPYVVHWWMTHVWITVLRNQFVDSSVHSLIDLFNWRIHLRLTLLIQAAGANLWYPKQPTHKWNKLSHCKL